MRISKRITSLILAGCTLLALFGCVSETEPISADEEFITYVPETHVSTREQVPTEMKETEEKVEEVVVPTLPKYMNPLTGLECDSALVGKRPIGVMFNNLRQALPQVGLSNCDIIYEVLAEGGITRFEGLILDYASLGELGSIRSARPYYVNIARAYDAIYVHAGGSDAAYSLMSSVKMDHFDGVRGNFKVGDEYLFWRNKDRLKEGYALEHTMFARGTDVAAAIAKRNVRTDLKDPNVTAFSFDPAFESIGSGKSGTYVKIPHSTYYVSEFHYDASADAYTHSHYKTEHIDGATGEQIKATNLFLLYTEQKVLDNVGRRAVTLTGQGTGIYLNGGEYVDIVWKRAADDAPFQYYNIDGSELKVEQGKSYICLVDTKTKASVTIS